MAVFRIEKTRDYTVMSNYHLRDRSLSLKAKGLLSLMLSLPEDWDYTMKGLARICKDGIDSISGGIRELEAHGYLVRARVRNENGQLGSIEYTILEQPKEPTQTPAPVREKPIRENPIQVKPMLDAPIQENPAQLNKEESSNYPSRTDLSNTKISSPIPSSPPAPRDRIGQDGMRKRESYRALILENIEYDVLSQNVQLDKDRLDELVELMVDTVCSNREMIRIAGDDYPAEVVKSRFLKIDSSHIEYVLERMRENTTYVRNIKKYLLAALYNAPVTMDSYYTSLVSHDLYGSGDGSLQIKSQAPIERKVQSGLE
ncbi:MAG: helix-turn-helix domain-containing protein [Oscillibacter sp.]|nr:helix-turn-helix domain-containing protein [Oscillibacter sp.]